MIVAHGIGGRQDLPIPLESAILGAVIALIVSFVVLVLVTGRHGEESPAEIEAELASPREARPGFVVGLGRIVDSVWWTVALRTVGMLFFAYSVMVAGWGRDVANNPLFGIFYIWIWVGLVPFSLVFGRVWQAISPVRTINAALTALRGGTGEPLTGEPLYRYPERLGYWPGAVGILAFAWMELVYPNNNFIGPVRLWLAIYVAVMLLGGQLFGTRFYERCDPFEVFSSLVAKLSVWGRDKEGRLVLRTPLGNLDTLRPDAGLVAVVSVLFGTIVFDSFRDSIPWLKLTQGSFVSEHDLAYRLNNLALIAFPLAVGLFFCAGTMLTGIGHVRRRMLPRHLAPSLVPIIVGYIFAHYLSYFWEAGQATLRQMSDPFSDGGDWFGTSGLQVNYYFAYHATLLANVKVLCVVVGHVLGVWSAHIRALQVLPKKHLVTGQIPLLITMIGFTIGGLYLLFAA